MIRILVRTYADLTFLSCLGYTVCFSYCVNYLPFLFVFLLSEVIFRSRVVGACPVTTDCIVAMS